MNEHQPRLWKPALFCLLSVLSIGLMYFDALVWPMAAAAILSLALAVLSAITLIWDKYIEAMYAEARKVEQYARMDPEQWNAIGLVIPTVRHVWQGLPIELWADTMARVSHMEYFVLTSNAQTTSPERNWNTAEHPRWAWEECYGWLVRHNYVEPDSATGNKSFRWYPGKYAEMFAAYNADYRRAHPIPNLNITDSPSAELAMGEAENA